nr:MAG TPA: hypothetical protein [Caudoviricetes sp.]
MPLALFLLCIIKNLHFNNFFLVKLLKMKVFFDIIIK